MYLVYLGESGNTGGSVNDSNQPHHVHVGMVVHERQWIPINGEFNAMFRRHFGLPPGEAGAPQQIKPADVYQGRGFFKSWKPERRAELIQDCLNILIRRETPVIASYIDKHGLVNANANGSSPTGRVVNRLLFALNMYLDELGMTNLSHEQMNESVWPINDYAVVVAGSRRSVETHFMTDFVRQEQDVLESVVLEKICYVEPESSICTQLADMCAYFMRRWLQNPSAPHPYLDVLRDSRVIQVIYQVQS